MFYNYKIENNILFLYVIDDIEVASFFNKDKFDIKDKILKYIKKRKIKFNGTIVTLIISGMVLGYVNLKSDDIKYNNMYNNYKYVDNISIKNVPIINNINSNSYSKLDNIINKKEDNMVSSDIKKVEKSNKNESNNVKIDNSSKVDNNNSSENSSKVDNNLNENNIILYRSNGDVFNLSLDDYLIGVVSAEMPASFSLEALKAQALVARTYTMKLIDEKRKLTDTVSTQIYKDNTELKVIWGNDYDKYYNKIKSAVLSTKDECIKYNGKLIDAVYHSTSNGYTEDAIYVWGNDIPYLKSVSSLWDKNASTYLRSVSISFDEISNKLGINFTPDSTIDIILRDESGRVSKILFDDKEYTGIEIRNLLSLRSTDFDIAIDDLNIIFTTRGYGHGVGLSQYGADLMSKQGYNYKQIINHYYTNVSIEKITY